MNRASLRHPIQAASLLNHRRFRPFLWNTVVARRVSDLSEQEFLRRCAWPSDPRSALAAFHEQARFRFFFHSRNRKDFFLNTLASLQSEDSILADADATLENKFHTLGSPLISLGDPIPWNRDFKSGKEWPARALRNEELLDLGNPSDVKVPWELSRFHQVWWLGKAYWLTGRNQYAEKFRTLIDDWIGANPPAQGVNWTVAMEIAIRAANWVAGYSFFSESRSCDDAFWMRFLRSLYAHGRAIEFNLEYSWNNGNHFLSDVVGMIYLGSFFAGTPFGDRWIDFGVRAIEQEMMRQVHPDGVDYEKSTSYHRLVLELFASSAVLCRQNNRPLTPGFMKRLEQMYEFVAAYTRPDGSIPLWGDADDGRLFRFSLDENVNDHRHALSTGAVLFGRGDFASASGGFHQETLWYLGGEGFERFQLVRQEARSESRAFPDGGCYIMRDERSHLFVDAGELGQNGVGGHGHNDTLSFTLWHNGAEIIVDPGTYAYTFDVPARQALRSMCAHNTVMVDNREIAEFADLWRVKRDRTNVRVQTFSPAAASEGKRPDILDAEHFGYQEFPGDVRHLRRFEFDKDAVCLAITDRFIGSGSHKLDWFLQLHPEALVEFFDAGIVRIRTNDMRFNISASMGIWTVLDSWFSRSYGVRQSTKRLVLTLERQLPFTQEIVVSRMQESSADLA